MLSMVETRSPTNSLPLSQDLGISGSRDLPDLLLRTTTPPVLSVLAWCNVLCYVMYIHTLMLLVVV